MLRIPSLRGLCIGALALLGCLSAAAQTTSTAAAIACATMGQEVQQPGEARVPGESRGTRPICGGRVVLYIARRSWHVDVGLAVADLSGSLNDAAKLFPGAGYLFFGFGDRRYLMRQHHRVPAMLEALWPGRALILTTGLAAQPAAAFGATHVIELEISAEQSAAAQTFIRQSFSERGMEAAARGPYEGSLYFDASARYSAMHTCNTWVAEVMHAARLPILPSRIIFAGQLWRKTRRLAQATYPNDRTQQGGLDPF